jgi:acetyl/propionyl-CoA carboxylase alpha subunit
LHNLNRTSIKLSKILIANRGEIAVRIAHAAADLGIRAATIYSEDDVKSLHVPAGDEVCALKGMGAAAYLDIEQIISVAHKTGCDAVHPGYGFLSESADFARRCGQAGLIFIGPRPETLELFGNKARTRQLAGDSGVPVITGTVGAVTLEEARDFFTSLGKDAAVMVKAVMGGGGRGIRPVYKLEDLEEALNRCRSEADAAFGVKDVYVEKLIPRARHIEVQVIGDGKQTIHMGERECTLQRRSQKLIEVAPSPSISSSLRKEITAAALKIADKAGYVSLGTFEFLIENCAGRGTSFYFMEANPRLQVEHTVTEEVTGVDLVRAQIEIAGGKTLPDLGLTHDAHHPRFFSLQVRVNMETMDATGSTIPSSGRLKTYEVPSGPGIRVDGYVTADIPPTRPSIRCWPSWLLHRDQKNTGTRSNGPGARWKSSASRELKPTSHSCSTFWPGRKS